MAGQEKLTPVSVYIPKKMMETIKERAARERRSVSSEIVVLLESALKKGA